MTQIAVLGANGQVDAEVCLLLRNQPDVTVVPICRNPRSSSFLRYHGMTCRHGLPSDEDQVRDLFAGADLILNFALAQGLPRDTRRIHEAIIRNSFRCAPAGAVNVYFSTMAVYGVPTFAGLRRKTAYSKEKLFCERIVRRESRRSGKPNYVFRLGHVLGQLQNGTQQILDQIGSGPLVLPRNGDLDSNTVYTATIVEAILGIIEDKSSTYDLTSYPSWSWRQIYEYEAKKTAVPLRLAAAEAIQDSASTLRRLANPVRYASRLAVVAARRFPAIQDLGRGVLTYLPGDLNSRMLATHHQSRARREIQQLLETQVQRVSLPDPWSVRRPLVGLTSPAVLHKENRFCLADKSLGFVDDCPTSDPS